VAIDAGAVAGGDGSGAAMLVGASGGSRAATVANGDASLEDGGVGMAAWADGTVDADLLPPEAALDLALRALVFATIRISTD